MCLPPEDLALWPHLSVTDNLAFGLRARRVPRGARQRRITEALRWVGLEDKAARLPAQLPGRERQRLAIARALVQEPVALLMDEPFGGLDIVLETERMRLLAALLEERTCRPSTSPMILWERARWRLVSRSSKVAG